MKHVDREPVVNAAQTGEPDGVTLDDLCDATGETRRTVRFYILNGLLTAPVGSGPAARYPRSHELRLRIIRKLQTEGMQLSRIREVLERTPEDRLGAMLASPPSLPHSRLPVQEPLFQEPGREPQGLARSQWERIVLEPGVELHLRRPLGVSANRRVQRLIEHFHKLTRS